jgi:TPR repeat protein
MRARVDVCILHAVLIVACKRAPTPVSIDATISAASIALPANEALLKRCDDGDSVACNDFGTELEARGDVVRAAELYRRACDDGTQSGCANLGVLYAQGRGVAKDSDRALSLFARGCDAGSVAACANLGSMTHDENLLDAACTKGNAPACTDLGVVIGKRDAARSADLFRRGCEGGNTLGCHDFALRLERGDGVARDLSRAVDLYGRACDARIAEA